jgi:flagellar export protein FliJ
MAKYKFRLATVQKVREARRDRDRAALAAAFRAEHVLAERRVALSAEAAELELLRRSAIAGPVLDVNRVLEAQRYELVLKARAADLEQQQTMLAVETERRRQQLIESDRDVRVLERLDARHRQEHRRHEERAEVKQLDEVASRHRPAAGRNIA